MLKFIIPFLFVFLSANIAAQITSDYIKYYNLCNEGDRQMYLKNYKAAFQNYDSAFCFVHYQHCEKLKQAAKAAAIIGNSKKATEFLRKSILNGTKPSVFNDVSFKKISTEKRFQELKDSAAILFEFHKKRINQQYSREIDSLHYIDQNIIRDNKKVNGNYKISKKLIPAYKYDLDSSVFSYLLTLINKWGFPSEENIGPGGYEKVWVLFHHNVRLPQNSQYLDLLTTALKNGEYAPSDYAWVFDQSEVFKKKKPFFYYGVADPSSLPEIEKKEVARRRLELGIKPIESEKVTVTGGLIRQMKLW